MKPIDTVGFDSIKLRTHSKSGIMLFVNEIYRVYTKEWCGFNGE